MKPDSSAFKYPKEPGSSNLDQIEKISLSVDKDSEKVRLDRFLASKIPHLSRTRLQHLIASGNVSVSGSTDLKPGRKLATGEDIVVRIPPPEPLSLCAEDIPLKILFEDEHLAIIDKQPGLVVHPGAGNQTGTLVHALLAACKDLSGIAGKLRPGIVHRLDKDTSGLMIVAKNDLAHQKLADLFKNRSIKKKYLALIQGCLPDKSGIIDLPIGRHSQKRTLMAVNHRDGRPAVTSYHVVKDLSRHQLLELYLHTGRTHQIRVHLSHLGHPLLGDRTYGGPTTVGLQKGGTRLKLHRQMLHSYQLEFNHPLTGESVRLTAPVPEDMKRVIEFLQKQ